MKLRFGEVSKITICISEARSEYGLREVFEMNSSDVKALEAHVFRSVDPLGFIPVCRALIGAHVTCFAGKDQVTFSTRSRVP